MGHVGQGPELLLEAADRLGIGAPHGLEGHRHAAPLVERPVDDPHAAPAQLAFDAISTQLPRAKGGCGRLGGAIASMA